VAFSALAALEACALISGASDLTTDPGVGVDSQAGVEGGTGTEGGRRDSSAAPSPDGSVDDDGGGDASTHPDLRIITFESGTVLGQDGADTMTGTPAVLSSMPMPLLGKYSMFVANAASSATASFATRDEVYVTFLFEVFSFSTTTAGAPITIASFPTAEIGHSVELQVDGKTGLVCAYAGNTVGVGDVAIGVVYRVGIHLAFVKDEVTVESRLVAGATSPFGPSAPSSLTLGGKGGFASLTFGDLSATDILTAAFDQVLIDSSALPPP
jgi:hypothetical protein